MLVLAVAWVVSGPLRTWRSIERVPFDPTAAREVLAASARQEEIAADPTAPAPPTTRTTPETAPTPSTTHSVEGQPAVSSTTVAPADPPTEPLPPAPAPADTFDVYLILGSDAKPTEDPSRADTIMLYVVPDDRSRSMLVSIPRSLYVVNPCTRQLAPINTNLEGCEGVGGLDLMGVAVEDYTGLTVDHLVLFDLAGFETIIDRIGGIEVCVDHPVKLRADHRRTFLEAGCATLDGHSALRWVRSRQTLEMVEDEWRLMAGAGDGMRTERQRSVFRQVLGEADEFGAPADLLSLISELSDSFVLDDDFDLRQAADTAWDLRRLVRRPIIDFSVAATGMVSPEGEFVLVPDTPFAAYLDEVFDAG